MAHPATVFVVYGLLMSTWGGVCTDETQQPRMGTYGTCYNITTPATFDFQKFASGSWYEVSRYFNLFELQADCVEQTFFLDSDTRNADVMYTLRFDEGKREIMTSLLNYTLTGEELQIEATYPDDDRITNLDIISTDYTSYAVLYSCHAIGDETWNFKNEKLWVLSRTKELTSEATAAVNASLYIGEDYLGGELLDLTNQDGCDDQVF